MWLLVKSVNGLLLNTPKAFTNLSPGFERSENPGLLF